MGYQVEYFLKLASGPARLWLSTFDGFWSHPEAPGELLSGEFRPWDDLSLHATLAEMGAHLRVPQIKYSWLIADDPKSVMQVDRLERLFAECLPGVELIRVDEFVRLLGEAELGRSWQELPDPFESLGNWLASSASGPLHHELLSE